MKQGRENPVRTSKWFPVAVRALVVSTPLLLVAGCSGEGAEATNGKPGTEDPTAPGSNPTPAPPDTPPSDPPIPLSSGTLKFHPGFYPFLNNAGGISQSRFDVADKGFINSLSANDNVTGIAVAIMWPSIDQGTSAPSYNWTVLDEYFNALKAKGKRLWVRVQDAAYGNGVTVASGHCSGIVPRWLVNKFGAQSVCANYASDPGSPGRGYAAKRYSPSVQNAYLAMFQAMAAHYDADPMFEGVSLFEETAYNVDRSGSAVTVDTPGADYSPGAPGDASGAPTMFGQLYHLLAGARAAFAKSNVQVPGNYLFRAEDTTDGWVAVLHAIQSNHAMLGGADSFSEAIVYPYIYNNGPGVSPYKGVQVKSPTPPPGASPNPTYKRAITCDEVYRGWRGGPSWIGKILYGPDMEISEQPHGYMKYNLAPGDAWAVHGPTLDKAQYFFFDVNNPASNGTNDNFWGNVQYPWVKQAGATNHVSPY